MENRLQLFSNSDLGQVRVIIDENNEPWFVAKDVAQSLGHQWNGNSCIAHVPDEWKGVRTVLTPGGKQGMMTLSGPGLYFFLGLSSTPKAHLFQKWIADEVLPMIQNTIRERKLMLQINNTSFGEK